MPGAQLFALSLPIGWSQNVGSGGPVYQVVPKTRTPFPGRFLLWPAQSVLEIDNLLFHLVSRTADDEAREALLAYPAG